MYCYRESQQISLLIAACDRLDSCRVFVVRCRVCHTCLRDNI